MARSHRLASTLGVLLLIYTALICDFVQLPLLESAFAHRLLLIASPSVLTAKVSQTSYQDNHQLPLLAIAVLGGYCIYDLVNGVLSMGGATEAYEELLKVRSALMKHIRRSHSLMLITSPAVFAIYPCKVQDINMAKADLSAKGFQVE